MKLRIFFKFLSDNPLACNTSIGQILKLAHYIFSEFVNIFSLKITNRIFLFLLFIWHLNSGSVVLNKESDEKDSENVEKVDHFEGEASKRDDRYPARNEVQASK